MRIALFYLLIGIATISQASSEEWTPDLSTLEELVTTPLSSISPDLFKKIAPEERIKYLLLASTINLFRLEELEKAEQFAAIATEEGYPIEPIDKIQLHALEMSLADFRSNTEAVALHGFEALELVSKSEEVPIALRKHIFDGLVAACFRLGRFDDVYNVASKAQKLAVDSNLIEMEAMAFADMAQARYRQGKSEESEPLAQKALRLFEKAGDNSGIGDAKKILGNSALLRNEPDAALEAFSEAISHYETADNSHGVANCCFNSGIVYLELKRHKEAQALFEKASRHFISEGSLGGVGMVKIYLPISHQETNEIELAEATFNEARDYLVEAGSIGRLAELEEYVGDMLSSIGRIEEARQAYLKALEIRESSSDQERATSIKKKIDRLDSRL